MYLFDNELFAIECMAKYAMEGLNVNYRGVHDGRRDEFAHCPTPRSMGNWAYYLTFDDHQHQGLLQSKDMDCRCFYTDKVSKWLKPEQPNFFELYGIFKYYISGKFNGLKDKVGELHPAWASSKKRERPVIVIKPDSTKLHFSSVIEAARKLGIAQSSLSAIYLKTGRSPRWGKFKNYQFFYAVKE